MKNLFFLLLISAVLFGCSKNSDDTTGLRDFRISLKVNPNHNFGRFSESVRAFLSDQNGNVLASGELQIGQTLELYFTGDPDPSATYDLSYMRYDNIIELDQKIYALSTFTNIEQGTYEIGQYSLIENSNDEIYLNLNNTGYPFEVISTPTGAGGGGPENGGYFNFHSNLEVKPTSDFYVSFKSTNDQFSRYFWGEDIVEGSVFNIDYTTLSEITNIISTQIPSNDYCFFSVEGLKSDDVNNIHHSVAFGNYADGNSSLLTSAPSNVFDNFIFKVQYSNENVGYSKHLRTTSIPTIINKPTLDFTVNNPSPQSFNMTTTGIATMYAVTYSGENSNENVFVSQSIYGKVAPEVSFSKENLRMNIQQTYPDLTGFETLPLGAVTLSNYSLNTYEEILKYRIEGKYYQIPEINGFIDHISKQFD